MKNIRKISSLILALLLVFPLLLGNTVNAAEVSFEGLNNRVNENNEIIKRVSGAPSLTDNKQKVIVTMPVSNEVLTAYKLADVTWSNSKYTDMAWVTKVSEDITATYSTQASNYATPAKLATASTDVWDEFYTAIAGKESLIGNLTSSSGTIKSGTLDESKGNQYYTEFAALEFGQYLILSNSPNSKPTIVNIYPSQDYDGYYITNQQIAAMKEADISLTKTINKKHADSVGIGDSVDFEISFGTPDNLASASSMVVVDEMSKAFSLASTDDIEVYAKYNIKTNNYYLSKLTKTTHYSIAQAASTKNGKDVTKITITFVPAAVSTFMSGLKDPTGFLIKYPATVTTDASYASENNFNVATLTVNSKTYSDEVKAYTYAVNVVKLDGSSAKTTDQMSTLSGAEFELYKEEYIYKKASGSTSASWATNYADIEHTNYYSEAVPYQVKGSIPKTAIEITDSADVISKLTAYTDSTEVYYVLTQDITLENNNDVIGTKNFKGTLDGAGYKINLGNQTKPLFDSIDGGTVKNLELQGNITVDASAETTTKSSLLCNELVNAASLESIEINSASSVTITAGDFLYYFGFLAGTIENSTITSCVNNASLTDNGTSFVLGGIVGGITGTGSTITKCANNGNLSIDGYCGGIAGQGSSSTSANNNITYCINNGTVTAGFYSAGIIANSNENDVTKIGNCYNFKAISSPEQSIGYSAGIAIGGTVTNSKTVKSVTPAPTGAAFIKPGLAELGNNALIETTDIATTITAAATACALTYVSEKFGIQLQSPTYQSAGEPAMTLAQMQASADYYVLEDVKSGTGTDAATGITYANGDTIIRVFKKVTYGSGQTAFTGKFTSVASRDGVTVGGLDVGNYIIMETKAPGGYNELAEDIYFEINRLTDNEAKLSYSGSLVTFKEMDTNKNESGIIKLNVLNYKGLMLPSTGGMGTLLFTIVGMVLMMITMIVILARRRKVSAADYM